MSASSSGNINCPHTSCRYYFCLGTCRWQGHFPQTSTILLSPVFSRPLKVYHMGFIFSLWPFCSKQSRWDPAVEKQSRAYIKAGRGCSTHSRLGSVLGMATPWYLVRSRNMVLVALKSCSLPFYSRQHQQNISRGRSSSRFPVALEVGWGADKWIGLGQHLHDSSSKEEECVEEWHCGKGREGRGEREAHVSLGLLKPAYPYVYAAVSVEELNSSPAYVVPQQPLPPSAVLAPVTSQGAA